ncbi:MAG: response regulator [Verrucomicrobiota bacterium]
MKTEKKRILAVDDQASSTRLAKLYLEGTNDYEVREENDPKAAIDAAEKFLPHLILLDVKMPGLDGWDLVGCFQANPKLKGVPIVFLAAAITKGEVEASGGAVLGVPFSGQAVRAEGDGRLSQASFGRMTRRDHLFKNRFARPRLGIEKKSSQFWGWQASCFQGCKTIAL